MIPCFLCGKNMESGEIYRFNVDYCPETGAKIEDRGSFYLCPKCYDKWMSKKMSESKPWKSKPIRYIAWDGKSLSHGVRVRVKR